jgi:hypothetical protein
MSEAGEIEEEEAAAQQPEILRGLIHSVNISRFRYHLLRWIVNRHISLIEVEDEDFQKLLLTLNQ